MCMKRALYVPPHMKFQLRCDSVILFFLNIDGKRWVQVKIILSGIGERSGLVARTFDHGSKYWCLITIGTLAPGRVLEQDH